MISAYLSASASSKYRASLSGISSATVGSGVWDWGLSVGDGAGLLEGVVGAVEVGDEATLEAGDPVGEEVLLEAGVPFSEEAALEEGLPEGEFPTLEGAVDAVDCEELDPVDGGVLSTEDIVAVLLSRYDDCDLGFG